MNTSFKRKLILFIKKIIDGIILLVGIITMEKAYELTGKITVILIILIEQYVYFY